MTRTSPQLLAALRERIRAIEAAGAPPRVLPFRIASLDAALPGGGLALGALHEVAGVGPDEEDGAVAAAFAAGILARLAAGDGSGQKAGGQVLWCLAGDDLYGPGLAAVGLAPPRLVVARAAGDIEVLWAMEEALQDRSVVGVLGEVAALPSGAGRRLQLAAEASGVTALVLRRWRSRQLAARQRGRPSAAATRWRVKALPSRVPPGEPGVGRPRWRIGALPSVAAPGEPGVGRARWHVELLRCRGGIPGSWIVEGCDASGHVALPAELADRPDRAPHRAGRG